MGNEHSKWHDRAEGMEKGPDNKRTKRLPAVFYKDLVRENIERLVDWNKEPQY